MAQYLLSVHTGPGTSGAEMTPERIAAMQAMEQEMKETGAWLFSGRLTGPEVATVVRATGSEPGSETLTTDGPFVESKEHLGGFYIVEADDLDGALRWAGRTSAIIGQPIEVRPFWDTGA
jgi:hypothetical protein